MFLTVIAQKQIGNSGLGKSFFSDWTKCKNTDLLAHKRSLEKFWWKNGEFSVTFGLNTITTLLNKLVLDWANQNASVTTGILDNLFCHTELQTGDNFIVLQDIQNITSHQLFQPISTVRLSLVRFDKHSSMTRPLNWMHTDIYEKTIMARRN